MSLGERVPFDEAFDLAAVISERLRPVTDACKAVGGLRRRRPTVGDIEFVVKPMMRVTDLLGGEAPDIESIRRAAEDIGRIATGGDRLIRVRNVLGSVLDLEINIAWAPANYWCLVAIRTGPAELSKLAVTRMRGEGLVHKDGRIVDAATGIEHPVASEEAFFAAANLVCVPPPLRDTRAATEPLRERMRPERANASR